jgi:hypothetical protein
MISCASRKLYLRYCSVANNHTEYVPGTIKKRSATVWSTVTLQFTVQYCKQFNKFHDIADLYDISALPRNSSVYFDGKYTSSGFRFVSDISHYLYITLYREKRTT